MSHPRSVMWKPTHPRPLPFREGSRRVTPSLRPDPRTTPANPPQVFLFAPLHHLAQDHDRSLERTMLPSLKGRGWGWVGPLEPSRSVMWKPTHPRPLPFRVGRRGFTPSRWPNPKQNPEICLKSRHSLRPMSRAGPRPRPVPRAHHAPLPGREGLGVGRPT